MTEHAGTKGWTTRRVMAVIAVALVLGGVAGNGVRAIADRRQADNERRATARGAVDAIMLRYHWEKWETDRVNKPFLDDLSESLVNQQYAWDFISPGSSGRGQPQDEFEAEVLASFTKSDADGKPKKFERIQTNSAGEQYYQFYQPIYAKKDCLHCHNTLIGVGAPQPPSMNEGDLMAIVKVTLRMPQ